MFEQTKGQYETVQPKKKKKKKKTVNPLKNSIKEKYLNLLYECEFCIKGL